MSQNPDMSGKTCLITGANSGLGYATAMALAKMGATIVMVCRNRAKGEAAQGAIKAASNNPNVDLLMADLSSQVSIRQVAADFNAKYPALHVLVNNAGLVMGERQLTADGYEMTFALNHLAYFLLTNLLLDKLKASAPARIVSVSSNAQEWGAIDFDDLMAEKRFSSMRTYGQSKRANVAFTYELARRLAGTGVTANAVHPGAVRTNFASGTSGWFGMIARWVKPFELSPERGAETIIYLASSPEVEGVTGKYFAKKRTMRSAEQTYDTDVQRRLWDVSAKLTTLES
jgi:NAD(P)-dependent dehydrogenase (short-subunit alcohol dehydrogenase family)